MTDKKMYSVTKAGLSQTEARSRLLIYGKNIIAGEQATPLLKILLATFKEPMFLLLTASCSIYFFLGEMAEGFLMLTAMFIVTGISLYQEAKSSRAVQALKELTHPLFTVIRDNVSCVISSADIVPGDLLVLEEGMNIPADAKVLEQHDLTVNESTITGESAPVEKNDVTPLNILYQGTTINSGKCIAEATATGKNAMLGKIGKSIETYEAPSTALQQQVSRLVTRLAIFGIIGFLVIFLVNFFQGYNLTSSLLFALTLAMSAVPEEIPVAFSSFMALGAYKMSKFGVIFRQPQTVESLGTVTVICLDKTGTITENKMQLKSIYDHKTGSLTSPEKMIHTVTNEVLKYGMLASETAPFDAMEKAIWEAYLECTKYDESPLPQMVKEYPLEGRPPMMTHVYQDIKNPDYRIIAAKGAVERIISVCALTESEKNKILDTSLKFATSGYRVIGVASSLYSPDNLPKVQDDFSLNFIGLLAFFDPPKKNISTVLAQFYRAKIGVKMITGDFPATATNIAGEIGMHNHQRVITGEEVMKMSAEQLAITVKNTNVFARMFPDAKVKVIEALKKAGEIVAMTGDGINDAPALRKADVGIAMGRSGTAVASQAADIIITDDDLSRMVIAMESGRKIFNNLKKAIRYIIAIHIPIILTASLPALLGWPYPNIFTPVHIIFLELIMGPTCSIFFENEPTEQSLMQQPPRQKNEGLFTKRELMLSILQGVIIAVATLILYRYFMTTGHSIRQTRTVVFTTLIFSNIFLTFSIRSFTKTIFHTIRYRNKLAGVIIIITILFLIMLNFIPGIRNLFALVPLDLYDFLICGGIAFIAVFWFEIFKAFKKDKT